MSVKTIYICDKCQNEQPTAEQFWTVGVSANVHTYVGDHFVEGKSMQVCRPCLESFGIYVRQKPNDATPPPAPPTVEELIREIVARCSS